MATTLYLKASQHPALRLCDPLAPCPSSGYDPALLEWGAVQGTFEDDDFPDALIAANDAADLLADPILPPDPPEPEPPAVGGGSIVTAYQARRRMHRDIEEALDAMRRPVSRAKRKKALPVATDALRRLVASITQLPANEVPIAIRDLSAIMDRGADVEAGAISFTEWRAIALNRIAQAQAEIEAAMFIQEEEEAAMFMLLAT